MLARTFLEAAELHCSEDEREAALKVLDMLEHNQIPFVDVDEGFNIGYWRVREDGAFCGCIGGWIEHVKGSKMSGQMINSWRDLFEPYKFDRVPDYYTPECCARALHAKLTTGKATWD